MSASSKRRETLASRAASLELMGLLERPLAFELNISFTDSQASTSFDVECGVPRKHAPAKLLINERY